MLPFVERLAVPVRWWALAAIGVLGLAAVLLVTPPAVLVGASVGFAAVLAVALRAYTLEIRVDDAGLTAGAARLPWSAIGAVQVLDPGRAAALRGQDADPRAHLALRGYVPAAVRVEVVDPADPTPYWYVSSRQPAALAAALLAHRG